jgi:hypothetical protein
LLPLIIAIYHHSIKIISRRKGKSVVTAAAKSKTEYLLDENGERIRLKNGKHKISTIAEFQGAVKEYCPAL